MFSHTSSKTAPWIVVNANKKRESRFTAMLHHDGKDDDTQPQVEEGIIECRWIHLSYPPKYRETLRARIEYFLDFWYSDFAVVPRP
jgi:hypothetical protein